MSDPKVELTARGARVTYDPVELLKAASSGVGEVVVPAHDHLAAIVRAQSAENRLSEVMREVLSLRARVAYLEDAVWDAYEEGCCDDAFGESPDSYTKRVISAAPKIEGDALRGFGRKVALAVLRGENGKDAVAEYDDHFADAYVDEVLRGQV